MQRALRVVMLCCLFSAGSMLNSCSSGSSSPRPTPSPGKTNPTITWHQPASVSYPTALSSTQLDATANVAGIFAYNPPAGTVLNAGNHTLTATFTPTDASAYNTVTASVALVVNPPSGTKTTPVISWSQPSPITNPAPLTSVQLDATANVPGTFAYNPPSGTVLDAGTQTLTVVFTPNNTSAYNNPTASVKLTVNPATTPTPDDFVYFGGVGSMLSALAISNNSVSAVPGSPFTVDSQPLPEFNLAAAGNFIFTDDLISSSYAIVSWSVNPQTGAITQSSSATQPSSMGIGADPSGKFLYAIRSSVYGFSIDQKTGDLNSLPGSPYPLENAAANTPRISPDGTWLCTGGFGGPGGPADVFCVQRDPSTGVILNGNANQVTGSAGLEGGGPFVKGDYLLANTLQFTSLNNNYSRTGIAVLRISTSGVQTMNTYPGVYGRIAVDPSGTLVAVSGDNSNLTLFTFDPANATLTQKAQLTLSQAPDALTFTCDSNYLAVSKGNKNEISVYSIANNGLQEIGGSPITVASGSSSHAVAACPGK